jgi:uncharacterized protein (DUF952 family)
VHFWDGWAKLGCHDAGMRIFHIATVADWERARRSGSYATSTRGRSLEDEGFLHAAHRPQVRGVFQRYYRDVREPLLLLTIDTERLGVPWREDEVGEESFPHIYGALSPRAVVGVQPLNRRGGTEPLTTLFVKEMLLRVSLAVGAMLLAGVGSLIGGGIDPVWGEVAGAITGLVVGVVLAVVVLRRR